MQLPIRDHFYSQTFYYKANILIAYEKKDDFKENLNKPKLQYSAAVGRGSSVLFICDVTR